MSSQPSYVHQGNQEPHLIQHSELKELLRDISFSKLQAELIGSRLLQWNLLVKETTSLFREEA
jgi:hypothetical protein